MSIINDALKKIQQGMAPKPDETLPPAPPTTPASGYIYAAPPENKAPENQPPVEHLPSEPPVSKSVLAMVCAVLIILGASGFFFRQLNVYFPKIDKSTKSILDQFFHKKKQPDFKTKAPQDLKPLAQITLNPAASPQAAKAPAPVTLNIHGIMSNATGNVVLINDHVYQEGDEVEGAKITKIDLDSVTVINNGVEQTIPVKG